MTRSHLFLLSVACAPIVGCSLFDSAREPYYADWSPPVVSAVEPASEVGNVGGGTVVIRGSGFPDDPNQLVVTFGDASATIVSVSSNEVTVVVPSGPISGGAVPVRVATAGGYVALDGGYTYEVGDIYDREFAYIQVNNFWESCLGGMSGRLDEELAVGCEDIAYFGYTGMTGQAEALDFAWPRAHSPGIGWAGASDLGGETWVIQRPSQSDFVSGVDELHRDVGTVRLRNPFWEGEDPWCVDMEPTFAYRFGGSAEFPDAVVVQDAATPTGQQADQCADGELEYDLAELQLCPQSDADGVPTYVSEADWPVKKNFFQAAGRGQNVPAEIFVTAPTVGVSDVPVLLPESVYVSAPEGFGSVLTDGTPTPNFWGIATTEGCFDDDGNGERLDDIAFAFEWTPSEALRGDIGEREVDGYVEGAVTGVNSYVRVTISQLSFNWFGTTSFPVRATIAVDDRYNYDRTRGTSRVEVPAAVMFQFPTVYAPPATGGPGDRSIDPAPSDWGYLIVTVERVTDYAIAADGGDVVFSYATGDFGFFEWVNPTDADGCNNCLDDDADGWADSEDPDCADGTEEVGFGDTECNDGRDNDGDNREDGNDPLCDEADDDDESNCADEDDNDEDGRTDADDPDCVAGGNEGDSDPPCENLTDDDGDGWIDAADPDCQSGDEEVGVGTSECNNGVDDDADGQVDAADADCVDAAAAESVTTSCTDGADDDADGWTDAADPDCALGDDELGFGTSECNNGVDDDADSQVDSADAECADATAAESVTTSCTDGVDDDADGWTDAADPDCALGDDELGFGTSECNNGVDDDADTEVDAADVDCVDANSSEAP